MNKPTPKRKPYSNPALAPDKKLGFLAVLAEGCQVGKACAAVGIHRSTAYDWRDQDEEFAAAWDNAMKVGVSALEDEAHRRAFDGHDEPVFHQGMRTDSVKKYSDTLAIFLLKSHAPEKYRDNSRVELSGSLALSSMTEDEMRAELAALTTAGALPVGGDDEADDDVCDLV